MELLTGAIVSLVTYYIQKFFGTSEYVTLAALLIVSVVAGAVWTFFGNTQIWTTAYQALIYASAVYAILLRRFPSVSQS